MTFDDVSQTLVLHLDADCTYEKGAKLLSFMAYPNSKDAGRRGEFHNALCHWALRFECETYPEDQRQITIKPAYFGFDQAEVNRHVKFLGSALQKRLMAGRMAGAYLKWFEDGRIPAAFGNAHSLSLEKVAAFVYKSEGYESPDNFETRFWRPSASVIHLCAAFYFCGLDEKKAGKELSAMSVLTDEKLLMAIIYRAMDFAKEIEASPGFPVKADQLIGILITP